MTGLRRTTAPPPVRQVHLGLGGFWRAHQAWYTWRAGDAEQWGAAAFSGSSSALVRALSEQDGLYTLLTRGPDGDTAEVVGTLVEARAGAEHEAWLRLLASPVVAVVTTTVTEAGYRRGPSGGLDATDPVVAADVAALRAGARTPVRSAPARLLAGLAARRASDGGPLALVPCDNLPENGAALAQVLDDLADLVDPSLRDWMATSVSVATTVVDRITPRPTAQATADVLAVTGVEDRAPVVTEPFTEWVVAGEFPAGRPAWQDAGAVLTGDVGPYERRKLWLLNGGHSLLALTGLAAGLGSVAEAVADPTYRALLEAWWDTCAPHLSAPGDDVARYRSALLERFANPRLHHRLEQIATDSSLKLAVRVLPVLALERARGALPEPAVVVLATWVRLVRAGCGSCVGAGAGPGGPRPALADARAGELAAASAGPAPTAVRRLLALLGPELAEDDALVAAVLATVLEAARVDSRTGGR